MVPVNLYPATVVPQRGAHVTAGKPLEIRVRYTLRAREWVWATAGLRPVTLIYDTVAAGLLLAVGIWEADAAYLLAFWGLSLIAISSYLWLPWLLGLASGGLRRATASTELDIDEAGLRARTGRGEALTEWGAVKSVKEVRGCLAIQQFSGRVRIVPERVFAREQLDELRTYVRAEGYVDTRSLRERLGLGDGEE